MKLLNDAILQDSYQVVMILSGLGGLTPAALLAKKVPENLAYRTALSALGNMHHFTPPGLFL